MGPILSCYFRFLFGDSMIRSIFEYFWRLLPDKCQMPGCRRKGVRGNENRIDGVVMCDDCHAQMLYRRMPQ